MSERLPSYTPLYPERAGFQYRRKCYRCNNHKPMTGGRTTNNGKRWICRDCRERGGANAVAVADGAA